MPYVVVRRADKNGIKNRQALDTIYVPQATTLGAVPIVTDVAGERELVYGFPGGVFSLGFVFFTEGDTLVLPVGQFNTQIVGWSVRCYPDPANAVFQVFAATSVTGSFTNLVGGGNAPLVSSAIGATSSNVSSWTTTTVASGSVLRINCTSLTTEQATMTLHFLRTA